MGFLLVFFTAVLTICYSILILKYHKWFRGLKQYNPLKEQQSHNCFSIVIPARDEADNIEKCILSILQNDYPKSKYEIIVVDDFSTDDTTHIVEQLQKDFSNIKLIQLKYIIEGKLNSYKKKAIETAISESAFDWIITTDADCLVNALWLHSFDEYIYAANPVFIAAPVMFINTGSFISIFQCLDFITLQGITAASVSAQFHSMCNGANLAYKKNAFYAVNGFENIDNIASGDDLLLMHKIKEKYPTQSRYLFNSKAIVCTLPARDWRSFINQRIRWASKATKYRDKKIFLVLLLVYLFNLCLFLLPFIGILNKVILINWILLITIKTSVELIFMLPVAKFFNAQKLLWWFPVMQPFHIVYTVISGLLGSWGKYEWKGRRVK